MLPRDDCHYGFIEHLSLVDIVSLSEASFHFNEFAEAHIFPYYTVFDMSDPLDFPPGTFFRKHQDLRPILNKIGKYVHTVVLRGDLLKSKHNLNVDYVIVACRKLRKLHLENIDMEKKNLPIRLNHCWLYDQLQELHISNCGKDTSMPVNFRNLKSLEINQNNFVNEKVLFTLKKNEIPLRRFGLLNMHINDSCFRMLSEMKNIRTMSLRRSDVDRMSKCWFRNIEINAPLNFYAIQHLFSNRYPLLRRLSANYSDKTDFQNVAGNVEQIRLMGTLQELHLITHTVEIGQLIKKNLAALPIEDYDHLHVHTFVYNHYEGQRRRWMKANNYQATCQLPIWNEALSAWCPCLKKYKVNRLRPISNKRGSK